MSKMALDILSNEETLKGFKERASVHARTFDIHNIIPLYEKLYERFL
jgi:L-malate glycosyltransferase